MAVSGTIPTFERILQKAELAGIDARSVHSRNWFREKAYGLWRATPERILRESRTRTTNQIQIGKMYFFSYHAKHEKTLPYYDQFPLIFPISIDKSGSLIGINMHYLPRGMRARLMDALYSTRTNDKLTENTKLRISYEILNSASKFRHFRPTIHKYLRSQLRSQFIEIFPHEWEMALMLPVENFKGANKKQVWEDSRRIIEGRK